MLIDTNYLIRNRPKILGIHVVTKRELRRLRCTADVLEKSETDSVICLVLSQGENANYCDHCYLHLSDLQSLIYR